MQSVASSSFNVKKETIQRGKLISCPFLWIKYNCSAVLEKKKERKKGTFLVLLFKMMHTFVPPQVPPECIEYYMKKLQMKWYLNTPSFRQRYKLMSHVPWFNLWIHLYDYKSTIYEQ